MGFLLKLLPLRPALQWLTQCITYMILDFHEFREKTDLQVITRTYQWLHDILHVDRYVCVLISACKTTTYLPSPTLSLWMMGWDGSIDRSSRDKSPFIGCLIFPLFDWLAGWLVDEESGRLLVWAGGCLSWFDKRTFRATIVPGWDANLSFTRGRRATLNT